MQDLRGLIRFRTNAVAAAVLMAVSTAALAAEEAAADWQYAVQIYGWLPGISGNLNVPADSGTSIDVDAETIIDSLQMTFMGSFEARKGPWSGFTDVIYLDLAGDKSKSVSVPDGTTRTLFDADLELSGWVWTLGGAYTTWRNRESHLELLAGARLLALDVDLELTGGGPGQRNRSFSDSTDIWNVIVGAKGRVALNDRWFAPYYIDVGTGDSDLTWQAAAGIGYGFDWGEVSLMYRYLDYDQGDDGLVKDLAFGGPKLGVTFRF